MASVQFFATEALSVSSTSVGFTSATYGAADYAHVYIDIADIRMLDTGAAVTTSNGIPLAVGDEIILESAEEVSRARFIRDGGTDATLISQFGKRN